MTKLPTAILGRTGIEVTRLGYGAGHRKPMTENRTRQWCAVSSTPGSA